VATYSKKDKTLKYIFVAGAPGSKWSSVVKNIYYSPSIDRSDYTDERTYYHDASGTNQLMHLGAYFDPGMEFSLPESMSMLTKKQAEELFDRPFSGEGIRIIKSHIFSYKENIDYLRELWPECPIVLVHRDDDSCLGWWVRCGHFNITYPSYNMYYQNLSEMSKIIDRQNKGIMQASDTMKPFRVYNNSRLALILGIQQPPDEYKQSYIENDIEVSVIC
jgi:hypothetical protein